MFEPAKKEVGLLLTLGEYLQRRLLYLPYLLRCVCMYLSHSSPLELLLILKMLPCTQWATKVKKLWWFSVTHMLQRLNAICLGWPYVYMSDIFPVDNTHVHCAYVSSFQCDAPFVIAVSSPCIYNDHFRFR